MKKTKFKKLTLNRETLTELDRLDLVHVDGGATLRCELSGQNTCATCSPTCTSNLC